jgi:hypothetical protein
MINRVYRTKRIERYANLLRDMEADANLYDPDSPLQLSANEIVDTVSKLSGPIYSVPNVPRYVLLRLNEALSDGGARYDSRTVSIEHVLPQNVPAKSEWAETFPDERQREELVHTMGNLVLLSRRKNSAAKNYAFGKKKNTYFSQDGGGSPFVLTSQVLKEEKWTPGSIRKRQELLLNKAKQIWRLETH